MANERVVSLNVKEFQDLINSYDKLRKHLEDPTELNHKRAQRFRKYSIETMKAGGAGLKAISPATALIYGSHNPMWNTGHLISMMGTRANKDTSADAGYFVGGQNYSKQVGNLGMGVVRQSSNISILKIVRLQHSGYKIPLFGDKGRRVRGFLASHGIFVKADKQYLIVRPRPFLDNLTFRYESSGLDDEVLIEYIEKFFKEF